MRFIAAPALAAGVACSEATPAPDEPPVVITSNTLPPGTVGVAYAESLTASGGNGTAVWTVSSGTLPDGLTLGATGRLSGTPTSAELHRFSVRVTSGRQTAVAALTLAVAHPPLMITTVSLIPATLGAGYVQFLDVEPGAGQAVWSLSGGALPDGFTLSPDGVLSGMTNTLGRFDFRVRVTRDLRSGERALSLTVVPPPLVITTDGLPRATAGLAYVAQLESRGGVGGNVWTLASGRLPGGLTLAASGSIAGTPTVVDSAGFVVALASGTQVVTKSVSLVVESASYPPFVIVDMPGDLFTPFVARVALGGAVTWRFGARPHNVIFAAATGAPADINIVTDVSVSRTFATPGTFRYDCTIHPGMSGRVEVKP